MFFATINIFSILLMGTILYSLYMCVCGSGTVQAVYREVKMMDLPGGVFFGLFLCLLILVLISSSNARGQTGAKHQLSHPLG